MKNEVPDTVSSVRRRPIDTLLDQMLLIHKARFRDRHRGACRFTPTCSEYMVQAIKIHGVVCGVQLGIKRLLRCAQGPPGQFDPVPGERE